MNLHFPVRTFRTRWLSIVAVLLIAATVVVPLAACSGNDTVGEPGVTTPVTLPDLTDDRAPTDTASYAARLDEAFADATPAPADQFTYTTADGGVTITGYTGEATTVMVPDTLEGRPVVTVGKDTFADNTTLTALSLPATVTTVEIGALRGCDSLAVLQTPVVTGPLAPYFGSLFGAASYEINASHVPDSLHTLIITAGDEIPAYAFYDCDGLEVVSLPATTVTIGDFAFYGAESLTFVPLAHTVLKRVGHRAFANCGKLLSLEIPATADRMGLAMLEGCGSLESLTLPFVGGYRPGSALTATDEQAIENKGALSPEKSAYLGYLFGAADYTFTPGYLPASLLAVTLHAGGGDLPANAFYGCATLRSVTLPEDVTAIGRRAFSGCAYLSTIDLPATLTTVGDEAFHGCSRLTAITGGEGLTTLGVQAFMDCLSLGTVTLPATVTTLPGGVFAGCRSLVTVTAPGVTTVGKQAFRHCDKLTGWENYTTTARPAA